MCAKYKYQIPDVNRNPLVCETDSQVVVIVGANGSGKSKLGAWMEQQSPMEVHRIAAQRSLSFSPDLPLKSYSQAEDLVLYGTTDEGNKRGKGLRWNWGKGYTTQLINDFENVLAALLALKNNENDKFVSEYRAAECTHCDRPSAPITSVDKLRSVWHDVYPQRDLIVDDSKFFAEFDRNGKTVRYSANEMSDGERAVLYFAAQILCIPAGRTLIIDEPEVHLHRSIMNRLWRSLMALRDDCLFVIITHDTDFAASLASTEKYWIRQYDGNSWIFDKVSGTEIPEQLLLEVVGSRKKVLLVEGVAESYDTRLYSRFYADWHVVPCGGCNNVINYVKAFARMPGLHHCVIRGIVDRDYRSDEEVEALMANGLFVLSVAEVENLFLVPELLDVVASQFACDPDVVSQVKDFIIDTKYKGMLNGQVRNKFVRELKYVLESMDVSGIDAAKANEALIGKIQSMDADKLLSDITKRYQGALDQHDYKKILEVFNAKELVRGVGQFFGISNEHYCEKVLKLYERDVGSSINTALSTYLPVLITKADVEEAHK